MKSGNAEKPYRVGDFLYHSEFGIGQVAAVTGESHPDLTIAFERSPAHTMSALLADRSTTRLSPLGFRALAYSDYPLARDYIEKNPAEAIRLVLQDFPEAGAKTPDIRDYLGRFVPDWEKWWKKAQKAVKESPHIDTSKSKQQEYRQSTVALSRAEELYEAFWRSTAEWATGLRAGNREFLQHDLALRVLAAVSEGAFLQQEKTDVLRDFLVGQSGRGHLSVGLRLDAIFRCSELHWLSEDEVSAAVDGMLTGNLRLSSLEPFARNRLVDYCLARGRSPVRDGVLTTGLTAGYEVALRVEAWILSRADPRLVVDAVLYLFRTTLETGDEAGGAERLDGSLGSILRLLPALSSDPEVWHEVAAATVALGGVIAESSGPRLQNEIPVFVKVAAMVAERAAEAGVGVHESLARMLVVPERRSQYSLMVLGSVEAVPPEFALRVREAFYGGFGPSSQPALEALAGKLGIAELVNEVAGTARDNKLLWAGIASVIVGATAGAPAGTLLKWLPTIETVCLVDGAAEWRLPLDALRERAYEKLLGDGPLGSETETARGASRMLDAAVIGAIRRVNEEREAQTRHELHEARDALERAEERVRQLEAELEGSKAVQRELGSAASRTRDDVKQLERVRVLKEVATTTAELERHLFLQPSSAAELRGAVVSLTSLLATFGVKPMDDPGRIVPWVPAAHQIVGDAPAAIQAGDAVVVQERGYSIPDASGGERILKPALVVPAEKGGV